MFSLISILQSLKLNNNSLNNRWVTLNLLCHLLMICSLTVTHYDSSLKWVTFTLSLTHSALHFQLTKYNSPKMSNVLVQKLVISWKAIHKMISLKHTRSDKIDFQFFFNWFINHKSFTFFAWAHSIKHLSKRITVVGQ